MNAYSNNSSWRLYIALLGIIMICISYAYTKYLTDKLKEEEDKKVKIWSRAIEEFQSDTSTTIVDLNKELTLNMYIMESNTTIPVILTDMDDTILDGRNFGEKEGETKDSIYLAKELKSIKAANREPFIIGQGDFQQKIYYKHSKILTLLTYFPFVQLLLISVFILIGYSGVVSERRAEQNRVWVGMAKETAHQLGTPISAIIGWIDHLRFGRYEDEEIMMVADELQKDVGRLGLVADRFSKIGSEPALDRTNIFVELEKCRDYMQPRSPRKVTYQFPDPNSAPLEVSVNAHLFDWVIENLLRNSLDAMNGQGTIKATVYDEKDYVCLDLSDTGKGIPSNKFKDIFKPGYTTKTRGWGLGLSLSKRIIEVYHKGKIFVKHSSPEEGTTFTIKLPKPK